MSYLYHNVFMSKMNSKLATTVDIPKRLAENVDRIFI
jgi:hypothetical protein